MNVFVGDPLARSSEVNPFEQECELVCLEFEVALRITQSIEDLELPMLQPVVMEPVTRAGPCQDLDAVPALVHEEEEVTTVGIFADVVDDEGG